jgi:rhodanese-related sulfurtransferase
MIEKRMSSSSANSGQQVDADNCKVMLLCPSECRDLIERFCSPKLGGASSDSRNLVILDVRTAQEYGSGHLNGSINLDFRSPSFADELTALDRSYAYLVYCRTGVRSSRAAALMRSLGFREVYDLAGGMVGWQRDGFEVVSDGAPGKAVIPG